MLLWRGPGMKHEINSISPAAQRWPPGADGGLEFRSETPQKRTYSHIVFLKKLGRFAGILPVIVMEYRVT
jgi:hypothetical protein